MADPYVYPGTYVLRNLLDIRDAATLQGLERVSTAQRMEEPLPDVPITYAGYKALHRYLFEELYEWAGEPRSVNIAKGDSMFASPGRVDPMMERQFTLLSQERLLRDLPPERFADRAAIHVSEINVIHPFREGNGRAQRTFLKVLAHQAGHSIALHHIDPTAWNEASIAGFAADYRPMVAVISAALVPAGEGRELSQASPSPLSETFRERSRNAAQDLSEAETPPKARKSERDIE